VLMNNEEHPTTPNATIIRFIVNVILDSRGKSLRNEL